MRYDIPPAPAPAPQAHPAPPAENRTHPAPAYRTGDADRQATSSASADAQDSPGYHSQMLLTSPKEQSPSGSPLLHPHPAHWQQKKPAQPFSLSLQKFLQPHTSCPAEAAQPYRP